jgi:5-phospho-D-xylono-1,4-lactonase
MAAIMTVRGPVAPSELGCTYAHDHLLAAPPPWSREASADPDLTIDSFEAARNELELFKQAGGRALVEMSTPDYSRDPVGLRRLSEATGIHVIMASGLQKDTFSHPITAKASVEELAARFTREVTHGAEGSEIRAGLIKAATSLNTITSGEEKLLHAAALAHKASGAPISTHTQAGTMGLEQIAILSEHGVEPSRIAIGHVDRKLEFAYHKALLDTGAYIIYDHISKEKYFPDSQRIVVLKQLLAEGYGDRIMFSGDLARRSYLTSYGGGPGFTYILWRFVPWLISEGVSREAVQRILVDNPARFFAF